MEAHEPSFGALPENKGLNQGLFPTTTDSVWALLNVSGQPCDSMLANEAFAELCRRYRSPILAFANNQCRRSGLTREDAEDVTQEFFLKIFNSQTFKESKKLAKFRSLLCACFRHHFLDWLSHRNAKKRGGEAFIDSFDELIAVGDQNWLSCPSTVAHEWDSRWAQRKFQLARERVRAKYEADGKKLLFDYLDAHCSGDSDMAYVQIAKATGKTPDSVKKEAERLRQHLRRAFHDEVASDFPDPPQQRQEVEDEVTYLSRLLCGVIVS